MKKGKFIYAVSLLLFFVSVSQIVPLNLLEIESTKLAVVEFDFDIETETESEKETEDQKESEDQKDKITTSLFSYKMSDISDLRIIRCSDDLLKKPLSSIVLPPPEHLC